MYNGIGLQTPRGSGTSGYIQSNVSLNQQKWHTRQEFLKELEAKRNANIAPPRKANQQIIQHERKRQILIKSLELREKLQADGLSSEVIEQKIKKAEEILRSKLQAGQLKTQNKDTHVISQAKDKQYMKLSQAFGLQHNTKTGSSFDFHKGREERLKRMAQKAQKRGFNCPHQDCGKKYDTKQHLARHLKYKHPKEIQQGNRQS